MDELLLVEGKVSRDEFRDALKLGVDRLLTFNEARAQWASRLRLDLRTLDLRAMGGVRRIYDLLQPFSQLSLVDSGATSKGCPVTLTYSNGAAEVELELGDTLRVRPDTDLIDALRGLIGNDRVRLDYQLGAQQRVR
jgi:DNA polymerase-3 subunit alpha